MPNLTAFGQYRIQAELGTGRFCNTYHAYDMVRHRPVALKLLHPDLLELEQTHWDFLDRVQQAVELVHPHIAWVWETGEVGKRFFIVERFVNGPALAGRLVKSGVLPWEQASQVVEQIAQALGFASSKGWTHGRVTPHNILLGPDQTAVLSDYGLQRALQHGQISTILQISTYDAQYLPPEVLQGKPVSPAGDSYALACTLVEMLTGKNPYAAASLAEIEQKHAARLVEPLFPPENAPWQISRVLEQALSPEPGERFKNAGELVAALKRATSPGGVDPTELARREAQVEALRLSEQQVRLQAEETARLAALEQARREIQEQAHREVQALEVLEEETAAVAAEKETAPPASARRERRRSTRPGPWPLLILAAILLVALASYWLSQRRSVDDLAQPTPTITTANQPAIMGSEPSSASAASAMASTVASATASTTPSQAFTATASLRPSATPTRTGTATKKPTLTPSPTPQPSPTTVPTSPATPEKPERPGRRP